ncbi:MAG TPA: hypothetical protein VER76_07270 [Pyrinomonadaceae bacterium]|nr:hypothetical protein [Pyrinomonadaceae bacterium]
MYCPACGAGVTQGLSFCNFCGAKLGGAKPDVQPSESFPESLVWAIVTVFIVGLGCIIGLTAMMKQLLKFNDDIIIAVMFACFLFMFVVEAAFLWLLLRRKKNDPREAHGGGGTDPAATTQLEEQPTKVLDATQPARSLAEPVASITEHTTRGFEPIYTRQKAE